MHCKTCGKYVWWEIEDVLPFREDKDAPWCGKCGALLPITYELFKGRRLQ